MIYNIIINLKKRKQIDVEEAVREIEELEVRG
jgi:hypothetical protein